MANTAGKGFVRWDTAVNASFDGTNGPLLPKVKTIVVTAGATGGTTTLTASGATIFSTAVAASTTIVIPVNPPQIMEALTMTAVGTNVAVTVIYD